MSDTQTQENMKTPWHLWTVGIIGLLWSAMGAMDFVMTQTENEAYMANFTEAQLVFFYGFPVWVVAAWAIAVWGGVFGSLFLLMRRKIAVWVFLASLLAMVLTTIQNYGLSNGMEVMGDAFALIFTGVIFLAALGLYLYAKAMQARGLLK